MKLDDIKYVLGIIVLVNLPIIVGKIIVLVLSALMFYRLIVGRLEHLDVIFLVTGVEILFKIEKIWPSWNFALIYLVLVSFHFLLTHQMAGKIKALVLLSIPLIVIGIDMHYILYLYPWLIIAFLNPRLRLNIDVARIWYISSICLMYSVALNLSSVAIESVSGRNSVNDVVGFSANQYTNWLGAWLLMGILINWKQKPKIGFLVVSILLFMSALLSLSRGGILSFTASAAILAVVRLRTSIKYVVLIIFIGSLFMKFSQYGPKVLARYGLSDDVIIENFTTGRDVINSRDLKLFYSNPLFGVGIGKARNYWPFIGSHSEWHRLLAEHGIFGILWAITILVSFYNRTYKTWFLAASVYFFLSLLQGSNRTISPFLLVIILPAIFSSENGSNVMVKQK